ncbi:MAG: sulfotransferase [Deltaproteobacteria bacterium]|nr:sulfotransferase [Deltaproteobacteria bacterium]
MKSIFLENEASKSEQFCSNDKLNALLSELKELLFPVQMTIDCPSQPQWPVGCIIGNPRSGSTLLLQFMASIGVFSYPTNVLTRFAYAPYIGALIQKMLFDPEYDFHGDFADIQSQINFASDLGKSKGALATNEFQHFFRNYMPNFDIEWLNDDALKKVDCKALAKGLVSIEKVFNQPFVTKANLLQYNMEYFAREISSLFYLYIKRVPIFMMQSILNSREKYYGTRSTWWSVKPKEYDQLKDMDLYHQIAGQVYFTEIAIEKGLQYVSDRNQLTIEYEFLCEDPKAVYRRIVEKYAVLGCDLDPEYNGPKLFVYDKKIRLPQEELDSLQSAYDDFASGKITFN